MNILEKLQLSGTVTLVSMVIVFLVLVALMYVIKLQSSIISKADLGKDNAKEKLNTPKKQEPIEYSHKEEPIKELNDDLQIVSVIMAALCASEGLNPNDIRINSIKRLHQRNWTNSALRNDLS